MKATLVENSVFTHDQDLMSEWENVLGYKLTPTEFEEIKGNLQAFFELLFSWKRKKQIKTVESISSAINKHISTTSNCQKCNERGERDDDSK